MLRSCAEKRDMLMKIPLPPVVGALNEKLTGLLRAAALERSRREERRKRTHFETALQDARARRGCHDIR